jgi:hypothetical protein
MRETITRAGQSRVLVGLAAGLLTLLGSLSWSGRAEAKTPGCPSEMVRVGDTCVDRWEGSLVELLPDGTEAPWSPYVPPNGHSVRAISRAGVVPQAHISYVEAKNACTKSSKRLCKSDEWVRACKGPAKTKFPYGDEYIGGACVDYGRTHANYLLHSKATALTYEGMNDPRVNQTPNTLAATGSANACTNEFGAFDMVGNLHEWADDARFHGGYYLDVKQNGDGCEYVTGIHGPQYYDYSIGFRCCADVGTLDEQEPVASVEPEKAAVASVPVEDRALEEIARASLVRVGHDRSVAATIAGLCAAPRS